MILLLAACEQANHELDQAAVPLDGLGQQVEALGVRLRDVLEQYH